MKVVHGLGEAEMTTMEMARRGNSMAGYLYLSFTPFVYTSPHSLQAWDDGGQDSHHGYQDYGVAGGGFHGHKKRLVASDPSPHVIFLGLDNAFTESDVRAVAHRHPSQRLIIHDAQLHTFLTGQGCSIETVTIIRERSTGTCPSLESFPGQFH